MAAPSLFSLALFAFHALWAAGTIQPLDLKAGLWETTLTVQTSGMPPMPPEVLAALTPQQRARIEAQAKAREHAGATTTVKKSCLEEKDANKPLTLGLGAGGQGCKQTISNSSATTREIRVECSHGSVKAGGTIQMLTSGSGNLKVTSQWSTTDGVRTMKVSSTAVAKWLGPICEMNQ